MKEKPVPLFTSAFSLRSILSFDGESSVQNIAKKSGLNKVFLVEDNMSSFLKAKKACSKEGLTLCFGVRLTITEKGNGAHKVVVFATNDAGYHALSKIFSRAAMKDSNNNAPPLSEEELEEDWCEGLVLCVPFYDSFVFNNSFSSECCIPRFRFANLTFFIEDNDLFMDSFLRGRVRAAAKNYKDSQIVKAKTIYYENREDFLAWQTYKCIQSRSSLRMPNLEYCGSQEFSMESWSECGTGYASDDTQITFGQGEPIYSRENFRAICFDFETEDLNLAFTKPWQLAYVVFDKRNIVSSVDALLDWKDLNVSEGAAKVTRFNESEFKRSPKLKDPRKVMMDFNTEVERADFVVGHNVLGFDLTVYRRTCKRLGLKPVAIETKLIDTFPLFKGFKLGTPYHRKEPLLSYLMRFYSFLPAEAKKRGFATLAALTKYFGIDTEDARLHDALYDVQLNVKGFRALMYELKL